MIRLIQKLHDKRYFMLNEKTHESEGFKKGLLFAIDEAKGIIGEDLFYERQQAKLVCAVHLWSSIIATILVVGTVLILGAVYCQIELK